MLKKVLNVLVEPVAFMGLFLLTINRIVWGGGWLSISASTFEKVLPEYISWILVGVLFLWVVKQKKNLQVYVFAWRKNWILLAFILLAICSLLWSEHFPASFYKVFVLIACSAIAAYIGITYSSNVLLKRLSWFFILISSLSYVLALFFPELGTNKGYPYYGAWRGWFTIKNYMGPIMSFGSIVFMIKLISIDKKLFSRLTSGCLYLLTAGLAFLSRSATAMIIFAILNGSLLLIFAWVKLKNRLRAGHYIVLGILFAGTLILALSNLDFLLGLLNKNTTLTGRLPMWSFLINSGISKHPLIGDGFGATWASDQFKLATQSAIGWWFAPITSHNGLVDIFLHLGLVGVLLFISMVFFIFYRVIRYALKNKTIISFFPVLVMIFILLVNISESFILELESFAWFLMIFALFYTTPLPPGKQSETLSDK
jgi:exopolysaccharide production protein ExoQ